MRDNDPLIIERSSENISFYVVTEDLFDNVGSKDLRDLVKYWYKLKGDKGFVSRREIDILNWTSMIGWSVIYDYLSVEDNYICRIFGEKLLPQSGEDMTGKKLTDYPDALFKTVRKQYEFVRSTNLPVCVTYRARTVRSWRDNPEIEYGTPVEKIVLPLSRSGDAVDCILVSSREVG